MHDDGLEHLVVRHRQVVGVQDAATSILFCVHQYDDVFIGDACQPVVQVLQVECRQVPVHVERIEVGVQGGVLPDAFRRLRRSALLGRCLHRHHLEAVLQRPEGLVCEHGFVGYLHVVHEDGHLFLCIAFGDVGDADAARRVGRSLNNLVGCKVSLSDVSDEDVAWCYGVCQRRRCLVAVVAKVDGDVYGIFRKRHEEHVLESFRLRLRLVVAQPLLEERREGVAVDNGAVAVAAHGNLSVAFHRQLSHPLPLAKPAWRRAHLVYGDVLLLLVAGEDVVNAQRAVFKVFVEALCVNKLTYSQ